MNHSVTPTQNTFHHRKSVRKHVYENHIKGWRLRDCPTCNIEGMHNQDPNCPDCYGTGRSWAKPDCITKIDPLIGETLRFEVVPEVDMRLHIQSKRRVIQQFIATDDGARDPRIYGKLEFGYDEKCNLEDWYVKDTFGGRVYLHQFDRINGRSSA